MKAPRVGGYRFAAEKLSDPLAPFASLCLEGLAYNRVLTDAVLVPLVAALSEESLPGGAAAAFARASGEARRLFEQLLPAAAVAGDDAVLVAFGVTANLQRTAAILAEHRAAGGSLRPAAPGERAQFPLSRRWCGLCDYAANAPYFLSRPETPSQGRPYSPRRRDARQLADAFWCSTLAVRARCDEAIAVLGRDIRAGGLFDPDDVRRLMSHVVPARGRNSRTP